MNVLYGIAFDAYSPLAQVCVTKGQTVTGKFYSTQVISAVEKRNIERRPKNGTRGIKLLHDNASSHKTKQVSNHIEEIGMQTLDHPPYSPDLSPCDFGFSQSSSNIPQERISIPD